MLLLKLVQPLVTVVEVVWQFQLLADLFCLRQEECASDEASFAFNLAAPSMYPEPSPVRLHCCDADDFYS